MLVCVFYSSALTDALAIIRVSCANSRMRARWDEGDVTDDNELFLEIAKEMSSDVVRMQRPLCLHLYVCVLYSGAVFPLSAVEV